MSEEKLKSIRKFFRIWKIPKWAGRTGYQENFHNPNNSQKNGITIISPLIIYWKIQWFNTSESGNFVEFEKFPVECDEKLKGIKKFFRMWKIPKWAGRTGYQENFFKFEKFPDKRETNRLTFLNTSEEEISCWMDCRIYLPLSWIFGATKGSAVVESYYSCVVHQHGCHNYH